MPKGKAKAQKSHNITVVHPNPLVGGNIFHDIGNGIVSGAKAAYNAGKKVYEVVKPVHDYVKDKKLISTISGVIPHPKAQAFSAAARQAGYGKGRRGAGRHVGSSNL